jgi:choline dehydrogenase
MEEFHYIIVGAGSAGCVLANRLTADSSTRVLLIEAGGPDKDMMLRMPAGIPKFLSWPNEYNWGFETAPDPFMNNRALYWPRGRGWGGSSSINGMMYVRGNPRDYDRWSQEGLLPGWSFAEVLPYFKQSESFEHGENEFHGGSGPLHVSSAHSDNPLFKAFIEAGQQKGYPVTHDSNGFQQEGFGPYQFTIHKGRRCSAATAYLKPAMRRSNLKVVSKAHATRVLFNGCQATGVEYIQAGRTSTANATREVILSSGVINTPQLLLLSGIGPSEKLCQFGIQPVAEVRGVGHNLQDHLGISLQHECTKPITLFSQANRWNAAVTGLKYMLFKRGLATQNGCESGAFLRSRPELEMPDLQFHFIIALMFDHLRKPADRHGFLVHINVCRPESRGFVALRSSDPLAPPLIQPNYFAIEEDRRLIRLGLRMMREVIAQKAFDEYRGPEISPGAQVREDAEIDAFVRETGDTLYHPVGTAKMGIGEDAVVDPQLRVRNVARLRVVDASIMPRIVAGNTNAATIMIAEKASDMILGKAAPPAVAVRVAEDLASIRSA